MHIRILRSSRPPWPSNFRRVFTSSVGTKLLIGLTGLALFGYLILHLAGQRLIFLGQETFNEYSHTLISNPLIVPIEIGLLLVFLLHVYKAVTMWIANQAARPVGYEKKAWAGHTSRKSLSSSTMIVTGLIVLLFVLVHVKQFKFGTYYAAAGDAGGPRPLSHRGRGLPAAAVGRVLRGRHGPGRAAPAPRDRQRLPVARARSPALHAPARDLGHRRRDRRGRRAGGHPAAGLPRPTLCGFGHAEACSTDR